MYKNKIKNKLQKIYNRGIDTLPEKEVPLPINKNESFLKKSSQRGQRGKLSLSKDLSIDSNHSTDQYDCARNEQSFQQNRKAYIKLVSNSCQKDLSCLSNSKICIANQEGISERAQIKKGITLNKSLYFQNQQSAKKDHFRNQSSFDAKELREMAANITKSTAFLNEKIVPVLLQAATHSKSELKYQKGLDDNLVSMFLVSTTSMDDEKVKDKHKNHKKQILEQTPINYLKNRSFDDCDEFQSKRKAWICRCETQPNNTAGKKYKNTHKIEHSPAPIKNRSPSPFDRNPSNHHTRKNSQNCIQHQEKGEKSLIDEARENLIHPLAKQLQSINSKRKAVENRISKKLDELSNKTSSMSKQYMLNIEIEQHPKKPKILLNSTKSNISKEKSTNCNLKTGDMLVQGAQNEPKSPQIGQKLPNNKNMRALIMNRIFS